MMMIRGEPATRHKILYIRDRKIPSVHPKKKVNDAMHLFKNVHQIQVGILSSSLRVNMTNHNNTTDS